MILVFHRLPPNSCQQVIAIGDCWRRSIPIEDQVRQPFPLIALESALDGFVAKRSARFLNGADRRQDVAAGQTALRNLAGRPQELLPRCFVAYQQHD